MITRHDIAFMVQEIISECHSRPKGAEMIDLIDKYADKFGKDNSGMKEREYHYRDGYRNGYIEGFNKALEGQIKKAELSIEPIIFSQQPPKERKVSLEEIIICIKEADTKEDIHSYYVRIARAILSLLNATEERKGEEGRF